MEKPKPKQRPGKYTDFIDARNYLEAKYNIRIRGYTPKNGFTDEQLAKTKVEYGTHEKKPYLDFWHWIVDNFEVHNGCELYLDAKELITYNDTPDWVKEILQLFVYEDIQPPFWVEW